MAMEEPNVADSGAEDGIDYQLGQHDTEGEGVDLGEGSEFLPWDLEVQTAMKRLAIDIYSSDESGVAEPETNGTATIIEAVEKGYLPDIASGEVLFEVQEQPVDDALLNDPDYDGPEVERELTIRDNGMGMTDATVRKVLRFLGRSLTRDSGNRSGQFGMGFVAIFLLTGWSAALELHTHSRLPGEEPISAVINNRGITIDHDGVLDDRMGDDEYGTKLKLILKDDIDTDDMRKWLRKNGEYARTPVTYRELDANGVQQYEQKYGMKRLEADYDDNSPVIVYEDEFVRAVLSPDADGRTLLLDVPIRRAYTRNGNLPWSFDIRLKNENGPIVVSDDPDRLGLYVTERGDYESMDDDRKAKYTHNVDYEEVGMARVAGTRDTLKRDPDFWKQYVIANLYNEYCSEVKRVLATLSEPADLLELSRDDLVLAKQAVHDCIDSFTSGYGSNNTKGDYTASRLVSDIESDFELELNSEVARLLVALKRDVTVVSHEHPVDDQPEEDYELPEGTGRKEAWEVAEAADGRVFMGVSINQRKADVVWEDSEDNRVVELDSASDYDVFESALGWERLADVKRTTIDEFDISDDLRAEFESTVGTTEATSTEHTEVTLTYRKLSSKRGRSWQKEWKLQRAKSTASAVRRDFEDASFSGTTPTYNAGRSHANKCRPRLLILFPDSADENISDYYWLASQDLALAKVSDDVAEYLTWADGIETFEDYRETAESYTLQTSEGLYSTGVATDRLIFHLLDESVVGRFRKPEVLDGMPATLEEMYDDDRYDWPRDITQYNFVYAPITREDLVYVRYHLREETESILITGDKSYHVPDDRRKDIDSDTQMYARSALLSLDNAPDDVRKFFTNVDADLASGGLTVVDALVEHYREE
jgi:hypothetical protein